jgi:hypothetical protein
MAIAGIQAFINGANDFADRTSKAAVLLARSAKSSTDTDLDNTLSARGNPNARAEHFRDLKQLRTVSSVIVVSISNAIVRGNNCRGV